MDCSNYLQMDKWEINAHTMWVDCYEMNLFMEL